MFQPSWLSTALGSYDLYSLTIRGLLYVHFPESD